MPSITVPGAIIGSAVLGGGASLLASGNAASASKNATDQSIALQKQQLAQTTAAEQPYVQAGYGALNALQTRMGLTAPGSASTGATSTPATGDYSAYLAANPDLASEAQKEVASGQFPSVGAYLQWHDANYGSENRPSYTGASPAASTTSTAPTTAPLAGVASQTGTAAQGAPVNALATSTQVAPTASATAAATAPAATNALTTNAQPQTSPTAPATPAAGPSSSAEPGVYGNADPNFTNPAPFSYTQADYTASPAYAYTVDQALQGVQASAAATGSLQSGDTLKALEDRASNLAYGDFNNERNVSEAQYNTDRAFNYQTASGDRNYLTGQFNTNTGTLSGLAGLGQSAASGTAAAGQNATTGIVNALNTNASTQANAGIAGANSFDSFLGSGVNALAYSQAKNAASTAAPTYAATTVPYSASY